MFGTKMWLVAQAINGVLSIIFFQKVATIIIPFALVAGAPAIVMFHLWLQHLKKQQWSDRRIIWSAAIVMPLATAICAFGLLFLLGLLYRTKFVPVTFPSIAATVITVLLFNKAILKYLQPDEADSRINENQ